MNTRALIVMIAGVAAVLFAASTWYAGRSTSVGELAPEETAALVTDYAPILGPREAPVTIVEFFDPACEACRAFHPIVKDLLVEHKNSVRVVIRYAPFHGEASSEAIRVLEAARLQEVFVSVLESLLKEQPRWASHDTPQPGLILRIAGTAGLDVELAQSQMMSPDIVAIVNLERSDVEKIGINQTPTFYVNGKPVDPFGESELRSLVAAEVTATGS